MKKPESSEYNPYFQKYIDLVPENDFIAELKKIKQTPFVCSAVFHLKSMRTVMLKKNGRSKNYSCTSLIRNAYFLIGHWFVQEVIIKHLCIQWMKTFMQQM